MLARAGLATAGRIERAAADVAGNGSPMAAHDLWRYRVELARCRQALAADEHAITERRRREAEVAAAAEASPDRPARPTRGLRAPSASTSPASPSAPPSATSPPPL